MGQVAAPSAPDRAVAADNFWSRCIPNWAFGFRREYANLFRPYSAYTHPTVMGVKSFITGEPPPEFEGMRVQAAAAAALASGLVVASHRWGSPPFDDIFGAWTEGFVE
jgi:hypothetical protein